MTNVVLPTFLLVSCLAKTSVNPCYRLSPRTGNHKIENRFLVTESIGKRNQPNDFRVLLVRPFLESAEIIVRRKQYKTLRRNLE